MCSHACAGASAAEKQQLSPKCSELNENMQQSSGHIELIIGPMFAGKTTELHQRTKRYQHANHRCVVVKFSGDDRYTSDAATCTHDGTTLQSKAGGIQTIAARSIGEVMQVLIPYSMVAIDEGQFFQDIAESADALANLGKIVVVSALDGTFERKPFNSILSLIPLAESVQKMTAVCKMCFQTAHFSKRTTGDTAVEVIGGKDMYIPVCRSCYHKTTPLLPVYKASIACLSPAAMLQPVQSISKCFTKKEMSAAIEAFCILRSHSMKLLMQELPCVASAGSNGAPLFKSGKQQHVDCAFA